MKDGEQCETCSFFEDSPTVPTGGVCHRDPPTIAWGTTPEGQPAPAASAHPPTNYKGWCGGWVKGQLIKPATTMPKNILPMMPGAN